MRHIYLIIFLIFCIKPYEVLSQQGVGYTTTTSIIENSNLVGDNEIDTGKFVILTYRNSYDIPAITDEEHEHDVFIKIASLNNLLLNKSYSLPDTSILITSYYWSPWHYFEPKRIVGTITRTHDVDSIQEISFHLDYFNDEGQKDSLLYGTLLFKKDDSFFTEHHVEYNGEYSNLRIALKEPLKVRKLDLSMDGVWKYQKNITGRYELPKEIEKFENLEDLDLHLASLKKLPPEFKELRRLKILDLGYNDFESFPMEIFSLDNLDSLNLEWLRLTEIPSEISRLKSLKKLVLDDNWLSGFPFAVTDLTELRELSITNGSVTNIPKEIARLAKLEKLDLGGFWNNAGKNHCVNLENLTALSNLKELNLEWNKIKSLPPEFSQFTKLEVLNIKYNDFSKFPEVIDQIPNLKLLIIYYKEFNKRTMSELKKQKKKYRVQIDYD